MSSLHPWMWRFGFPGFAETVWVLPAGVPHDAPEYEPMPWPFPHREILDWAERRECRDTLLALHHATTGAELRIDPTRPLRCQIEGLREAFYRDRIVAWRLRVFSVSAPARLPIAAPVPPRPEPTKPEVATWTLDSFAYVDVIAPGAEDPKPLLRWAYTDREAQISGGRIDVYATGSEDRLGAIQLTLGVLEDRELPWDGHVGGGFKYGYVTCEHPSYTLRLVLDGVGGSQSQAVSFRVEIVDFTLRVGPRNLITLPRHLEVYDFLFTNLNIEVPADNTVIRDFPSGDAAGIVRVPLRSNIFWNQELHRMPDGTVVEDVSDSEHKSRASFEQYRQAWGDGPDIPVIAAVLFLTSTGGRVLAPKAWGRRNVLFTWEEQPENLGRLQPQPQEFVRIIRKFRTDEPAPFGGTLCHVERGGKRSPDGQPPMFESGTDTTPFRVRPVPPPS